LTIIDLARSDRFEEIRQQLAPVLRRLVSPQVLRTAWQAEATRSGDLQSLGEPITDTARDGVVVRVPLRFERGTLTLVISMRHGRLLGIRAVPGGLGGAARVGAPTLRRL